MAVVADLSSQDALIFDGARTAFGRHGGSLSRVRPDDLLAHVIKTLVSRNSLGASLLEDVIVGNTNQAGEDCRNVARFAGLLAGLPLSVGGQTVNRLCGSGLAAVLDASRAVKLGDGDLFVAGGVESMSRAPLVLSKATSAFSRTQEVADSTMGARFTNPLISAEFGDDSMPQTADNVAAELAISREDCDRFALSSQLKYDAARQRGFFDEEIIAIDVPQGRRQPDLRVEVDEHPRSNTQLESLAKLRSLNPSGVVTAGNASGINDGAAGLLLGNLAAADKSGMVPRGRIVAGAIAGVEPRVMGLGPVPATRKALARAGLSLADMDVIECNEAFAAQALGCLKQLDIAFDDPRVNPNGGAIAVGHPLGASGARILLTALRQLEAVGGRYALVSMCIGLGQGIAVIIERIDA